jgi:hypothetical protein
MMCQSSPNRAKQVITQPNQPKVSEKKREGKPNKGKQQITRENKG